ncbi:uncharacterized protein A4U43_C08F32220 [Asparagus officinalis]|uniref:uncharacterized protein LOC109819747 n=1 Tax=Asparagus officinalis TaxID=4686 RepID=UPI00098DF1C7|nr:uncharacterized protein LOC109819747 [Asparagus officinalis]ONK61656.1 uncharacterized protein A4U43_C08F32220 [Asparagus officinalis]
MGAGRKTKTITVSEDTPFFTESSWLSYRNLPVKELGGVIFGCTHDTFSECLSKKLFGLPYGHISYVKKISIGLPLFLFNYSDRNLYGIFEAASHGQTYLNASAWTDGGSQTTPFPAQVRVRTRVECQALVEKQFKKIIEKNYYNNSMHFWFELDHGQTRDLIALFEPSRPAASTTLRPLRESEIFPVLPATTNKKELPQLLPATTWKDIVNQNHLKQSNNLRNDNKFASLLSNNGDSEQDSSVKASSLSSLEDMESKKSASDWEEQGEDSVLAVSSSSSTLFERANHVSEKQQFTEASECEEKRVLHMLENLAAERAQSNSTYSSSSCDDLVCAPRDEVSITESYINHGSTHDMEKPYAPNFNGSVDIVEYPNTFDLNHGNNELVQFIKEVKEWSADVKKHQAKSDQEIQQLRNQLWHSERKIGILEDHVKQLELKIDPCKLVEESLNKFVEQYLGTDVIYLIGGFDGYSWLSSLDSFSPSLDIITPLKSMSSPRSYASSVALDGNLFVFGGRSGNSWFDTVECYNRRHDKWISCPSMLRKKGSLSGATLNGKIFAIGGGDDVECLPDVETFDPASGKWIANRPMFYKRFASTAAELKGAIYAVGGYDGYQYLRSAEKYDPREGRWTHLPDMRVSRGGHVLATLNEKLYCIGGYDCQKMVSSVEIFDPRLNTWMMGDPMRFSRGYGAAVVLGNSLYAIGGIDDDSEINTVECYRERVGWSSSGWKAIGKRSFFSAVVL